MNMRVDERGEIVGNEINCIFVANATFVWPKKVSCRKKILIYHV